MPSLQLAHRAGLLDATPTGAALSAEDRAGLQARIQAAEELGDLQPADRALLRKAVEEVAAGRSELTDPLEWGDWRAIDAAIDADDEAALERALDTVGRGIELVGWDGDFSKLQPLVAGEPEPDFAEQGVTDDPEDLEDPEDLPDVADDQWVGL